MRALFLAFAAATLLLPYRASAQSETTVIIDTNTDTDLSQDELAPVLDAVEAALRAEGIEVEDRQAARRQLGRQCTTSQCAAAAREELGVDFATVIALWDGAEARELVVALTDETGVSFSGATQLESLGDPGAAATEAVTQALARMRVGPGPFLLVSGTPAVASVWLDGQPVSEGLPFRTRLEPGIHDLEVRAEGHEAHRQAVDIPREPLSTTRVEVTLSDGSGGATPEPLHEEGEGRSALSVVGPVVLGLGGVAALTAAAYGALLAPEDCVARDEATGACLRTEGEPNPPGIAAWAAVGVAGVVGAIAWYILAGPDEEPSVEEEGQVSLRPTRTGLAASWSF